MKHSIKPEAGTPDIDKKYRIEIVSGGPYLVYGNPPITRQTITPDAQGNSWSLDNSGIHYEQGQQPTALCRCGHTRTPPYCDGSHLTAPWDPTLTAPRTPLMDDVEVTQGQTLALTDNESYCAFARFCDAKGRTWNQVERSDNPKIRQLAIRTANACPAGRLKVWDRASGEVIEPELAPAIALLEDPAMRCSGPIYVMGGIPVTDLETGFTYQPRNRVTLCRCGNSCNKPFCDGTHVTSKFHDML